MKSRLQTESNQIELTLPEIKLLDSLHNDTDYYGVSHVFSKYLKLKTTPSSSSSIIQHGWIPDYWEYNPIVTLASMNSDNLKAEFMVWRKSTEERLIQEFNYEKVKSIGSPVVYLEKVKIERIPKSLLVMPMHSLDFTKHNHWKFQEYADQINEISGNFEKVTICVHPSCISNGYWINEFQNHGFEIIEGANIKDINALIRLQQLFLSYEYVTTNGLGTHIPYAMYFGAKVSIYGDIAEVRREDHDQSPYYIKFENALTDVIDNRKEERIKEEYPNLFVPPDQATIQIKVGKFEVGETEKKSMNELSKILGWRKIDLFKKDFKKILQSFIVMCSRVFPASFRQFMKENVIQKRSKYK